MTIQPPPPNDETPPPLPETEPVPTPIDTPDEPEQSAPGADQPPMGAPRDEPDAGLLQRRWPAAMPVRTEPAATQWPLRSTTDETICATTRPT